VFVVDDDVSVRESLESLIRCEGWQPETFGSAQEFLDYPRVLIPNCLVLDVSLPGLNGLGLQRVVAGERTVVPFYVSGEAVGTIWAIMHSDRRKFDAEDDRVMACLGSSWS
jgi:FixJ family two-component response regulator